MTAVLLPILCTTGFAQTWIQTTPGTGSLPFGRIYSSVGYNPSSNNMVLFGGYTVHTTDPGNQFKNDVWALSNANGIGTPAWTQLLANGSPGSPGIRCCQSSVYDSANDRFIIYSGQNPNSGPQFYNDVWVLANAGGATPTPAWTQLTPSGTSPEPRRWHGSAYDSASNRMIVFGGEGSFGSPCPCTLFNDVWVLMNANGIGAAPQWVQLSPSGLAPLPRSGASVSYDPSTNSLIVFGGATPGLLGDVWVLTNANGLGGAPVWHQLSVTGTQIVRAFASTGYDPASNRLIVFGGFNSASGNTDTNDVWVLTNANGVGGGAAWQQLQIPGTLPIPRDSLAGAYDPAQNRMVIFGGQEVSSFLTLNDSWALTDANGVASSQLQIGQILPNSGGNSGNVTVQILGSGFQAATTITLTSCGPDVVGGNVSALNTSALTTTFNLTAATPGVCNVVVANPEGTTATITGGFTIEQGGDPDVRIGIIGRDVIRSGLPQTYYGVIQNHGTVDALNIAAFINQPGLQTSAFFGPLAAGSSINIPFTAIGPQSGCTAVRGAVHTVNAKDPCTVFKAAKAALDSYLDFLYGLQLDGELLLFNSILPPSSGGINICFNPSNIRSSAFCDAIETSNKALGTAISVAEDAEMGLCKLATAARCPLNCGDPTDINNLEVVDDGVEATVAQLKKLFALMAIPPIDLSTLDSQVAVFETQALALPTSLVFPSQPQPQPPVALPVDNGESLQVCAVSSLDPNSKTGPNGVGSSRYVQGTSTVPYEISFQNDAGATAPAQSVTVTDALDPNLNPSALTLGPITFSNQVVNTPPIPLSLSPFRTTVDLRPATNLLVQVTASLNGATLTVTSQSIDPSTGQPPTDPTVGFLPPGADGSVFFTIAPQSAVTTGTVVQNTATVVFDANPPINTPTWTNTIDNTPPVSHVSALSAQSASIFTVQWSGTDIGSGLGVFTIYVSDSGSSFVPWVTQTTATSGNYVGQIGHTYSFYSIARDLVGNVEPAKTSAEATTLITSRATPMIMWSAPAAITFGGALSSIQLDATANVPGVFVYTPPAGSVLPVGGGQTLSVAFTPNDAIDYNSAAASTTITVNPAAPPPSPADLVVTKVLTRSGGNVVVQLTIANTGGTTAANVVLATARVGSDSAMPLPQSIGNIGAGASAQATVTVPGSVGASGAASSLTLSGTYTGGSFSSSARITLP